MVHDAPGCAYRMRMRGPSRQAVFRWTRPTRAAQARESGQQEHLSALYEGGDSIVQRSICGHATQEMSELYSTVGRKEIQRAVGQVISMVGYRELTLGAAAEYARSMQAENGPSEGPDEASAAGAAVTLTP